MPNNEMVAAAVAWISNQQICRIKIFNVIHTLQEINKWLVMYLPARSLMYLCLKADLKIKTSKIKTQITVLIVLALIDFIIIFILISSLLVVFLLFPCSFLNHWYAMRSDNGTINAKTNCFSLGQSFSADAQKPFQIPADACVERTKPNIV